MTRLPIGQRIRNSRKDRGYTQTALAEAVGISPSYLNLIEHDRRAIGGALLKRIARMLDVDLGRLSGSDDAQLTQDIAESARSLSLPGLDARGAQRLVALNPEWAAAFRALHRLYQDASTAAHALSDRLGQDPRLIEVSHAVLTQITSIRAAAEILQDNPGLDSEAHRHFMGIVASQSDQLGSSAQTMMALLAGGPDAPKPASAINEVDDFVVHRGNYFPELEEAALHLRLQLGVRGRALTAAIADRLAERHGMAIRYGDHAGAPEAAGQNALVLDEWAHETSHRFQLARRLVELELADPIGALLADPRLGSREARRLARRMLANYGAGALLFRYDRFLDCAESFRYDVDRLCLRFGGSFEQIAHRLVTLRRPDAAGVPFAFLRSDPAGNLSKPFSIPGLRVSRLAGACPLWALYAAFASPDRTIAQLAVMPQGERYLLIARRLSKGAAAYGGMPTVFSVMIGCDAAYGDRLVYGDAFAGGRDTLATPVGFSCRSCPREGCAQRAQPAILPRQHQAQAASIQTERQQPPGPWRDDRDAD